MDFATGSYLADAGGVVMRNVISKEVQFDAGHRVPNHTSKCRNPHGHRYRVVAHCQGDIIRDPDHPSDGMLIDFGRLKDFLNEIHDEFDHGFIVHRDDEPMRYALGIDVQQKFPEEPLGHSLDLWKVIVVGFVPTAENLAGYIFGKVDTMIAQEFKPNHLELCQVDVWETPTSMASCHR